MKTNTKSLASAAMIAALYTVLTAALAPVSYGMLQVRVSEALTLLPVYSPAALWGVVVGCLLSNVIGLVTGANILGAVDILFGTLATLLAALVSRMLRGFRWKGLPVLSALPPVVVNALVVGAELYYVTSPQAGIRAFFIQAGWVALGELAACFGLGLPLCWALQKARLDQKLFSANSPLKAAPRRPERY